MSDKHEFMSEGWLRMVEAEAQRLVSEARDAADFCLAETYEEIPQQVTVPAGGWTLRISAGKVRVERGCAPSADVTLTARWEDALKSVLIADAAAHRADLMARVMAGRVRIQGDPKKVPPCLAALHSKVAVATVVPAALQGAPQATAPKQRQMGGWDRTKLPKPTPDIEQVKRDVREWGYGILTGFLSPAECDRLLARLKEQAELEVEQQVAWLGNGGRGGNTWIGGLRGGVPAPWQGIRTLLNKGREFIDLMMNPQILECMRSIFNGLDFYMSSTNGLIVRKGAVAMGTHVDQQFVPGETVMPFAGNVMVTLSHFTEAMGATRVVPGSHRWPPPLIAINEQEMDFYNVEPIESVPAECPAGSAIVLEGRVWHCSGASTSDEVRYSVSTYYVLPFMRPQDAYIASLRDDVYAAMSEAERAMCGFKTGPLGRIDPRRPGDRVNTDLNGPYIPELRRGGTAKAIAVGEQKFLSAGTRSSMANTAERNPG